MYNPKSRDLTKPVPPPPPPAKPIPRNNSCGCYCDKCRRFVTTTLIKGEN